MSLFRHFYFVFCVCRNRNTNFTTSCDNSGNSTCKCGDFISFSEPPYEENTMENIWCGRSPYTFQSRGRVLVINYVYQSSHDNPFNLTYLSESTYILHLKYAQNFNIQKMKSNFKKSLFAPEIENIIRYEGFISDNQTTQIDELKSPFFPNFYPRDLSVEHLIECRSNDTSECHIEISFSDFQIALPSAMEVRKNRKKLHLQRKFNKKLLECCSFMMLTINWCHDTPVKYFVRQSFICKRI